LALLATIAVLIASVWYLAIGVLNTRTLTSMTTVTITAPKSNGLHAGSAVSLRGAVIGDVRQVRFTGENVVIDVAYDAAHQIPVDSEIMISNQSMLGESALVFLPRTGEGPMIGNGQKFSAGVVDIPASVPELLGSTQTLLDQFDPAQVNNLVDTLRVALAGTGGDVQRLTPAAKVLAATMIYSEPALVKIMRNATPMISDGSWMGPSLRATKPQLLIAGANLSEVITHVKPFADFTDGGRIIGERWKPSLQKSAAVVGELVPPIARLAEALVPTARLAGASIFDSVSISALMEQAMQSLPGDALRLTIVMPK
ncbi:MlaD family protein, partial [uncultured Gordonia sp.]